LQAGSEGAGADYRDQADAGGAGCAAEECGFGEGALYCDWCGVIKQGPTHSSGSFVFRS
jgi:hypothetical protein